MINSEVAVPAQTDEDDDVDRIVQSGAIGALTVAAIATAAVMLLWLAFYVFVFMARSDAP